MTRAHRHDLVDQLRDQVVGSTERLFAHGPPALEHTLDYPGDPGLLGPDSVSWRVIGDTAAFVGGIRALLVQTAHPEVVAGVEQHSRYRDDPLGRLSRTSVYVAETTYGAMPEVEAAVATVRSAHRHVNGHSDRNRAYRASDPALAAWVHNVLTDSFLVAFQAYGPRPLSVQDADRFVEEQTRIGALLGASPLPTSAAKLSEWIAGHPALASSDAQKEAIGFLRNPPLPIAVKIAYKPLLSAAVHTIPRRIQLIIGVHPMPSSEHAGAAIVKSLRWALGSSPSWNAALTRSGATVPTDMFRQRRKGPVGS